MLGRAAVDLPHDVEAETDANRTAKWHRQFVRGDETARTAHRKSDLTQQTLDPSIRAYVVAGSGINSVAVDHRGPRHRQLCNGVHYQVAYPIIPNRALFLLLSCRRSR